MPRTRSSKKNLPHLPAELWTAIISSVRPRDLPNVALCSKLFHAISLRFLYEDIEITNQYGSGDNGSYGGLLADPKAVTRAFHSCTNGLSLFRFARSMQENPELCGLVKSVHFNTTGPKDNMLLYALSHILEPGQIHLQLRCRLSLFNTGTPFNLTSLKTHCGRRGHDSPVQDKRLADLIQSQPTLKRLYLTCDCHCPHFDRLDCKIDKSLNIEHLSVTAICYHRHLFQEIVRNCVGLRSLYYCCETMPPPFIAYKDLEALLGLLEKHVETLETLYMWNITFWGVTPFLRSVPVRKSLKSFTSLKRLCLPATYLIILPRVPGEPGEFPSSRREMLRILPPSLEELHIQIVLERDDLRVDMTTDLMACLRTVIENKISNQTPHLDSVVLWITPINRRAQRIIQPYKDTPDAKQLRYTYLEQGTKLSFWGGNTGPLFKGSDVGRLQAESFGYSRLGYTPQDHERASCSAETPNYTWRRLKSQHRISWDDIDDNPEFYRRYIASGHDPTIAFIDRS